MRCGRVVGELRRTFFNSGGAILDTAREGRGQLSPGHLSVQPGEDLLFGYERRLAGEMKLGVWLVRGVNVSSAQRSAIQNLTQSGQATPSLLSSSE